MIKTDEKLEKSSNTMSSPLIFYTKTNLFIYIHFDHYIKE